MPSSADVEIVCLRVPRHEIALVKFVFESYEGMAVTRTLDRHAALMAILIAPDFLSHARTVVEALVAEIGCEEVPTPHGLDPLGPDDESD